MKNLVFILLLFSFLSCSTSSVLVKKNKSLYITFGSCFKGEKNLITINGVLLGALVLQSDLSLGIVKNYAIEWDGKYLFLLKNNDVISKNTLEINKEITITISGDKFLDSLINLQKGRYIIIDACTRNGKLLVNQYKKPPSIE